MKNVFILLVVIEIAAIYLLGVNINKKAKILGTININPIQKDHIVVSSQGRLNFFYEPKPQSKQIDKPLWMKSNIIYTINSDSLNEEKEYSLVKSPQTFRIITLGDSHTFGMYVQTNENWSNILENMLNHQKYCKHTIYEVINLGVSGYDIQYAIERFKIRGLKYNPDLVIWFIKGDDFTQYNEKMLEIKNELKQNISGKTELEYWNMAWQESKIQLGEKEILKQNAEMIKTISNYYQGKLIIMSYPHINNQYQDIINGFLEDRTNTYLFNNIPAVYERSELNFSPYDSHPNREGHRLIAEDLFAYLKKNNFIICK